MNITLKLTNEDKVISENIVCSSICAASMLKFCNELGETHQQQILVNLLIGTGCVVNLCPN